MNRRILKAILCLSLAVMILAGTGVLNASAASSGEIRSQIDALEEKEAALREQMAQLEAQMGQNRDDIADLVQEKNAIDQQILLLHEQIDNINERISAYSVLIADKQDELSEAEARLALLNEQYRGRIRAMEEAGELSYWSVLFKANSFTDLLDRLNMVQEIAEADQRRMDALREASDAVATAAAELEGEKDALEETRDTLEQTQLELDGKRADADELFQELLAKGAEFDALMEQSEAEQDALMAEIAQMEKEFDRAAYREWLATSVPPTTTAPKPTEPAPATQPDKPSTGSSKWLTPVPYYTLTSPFGMRLHPVYGTWKMHNGVDLACAEGTEIYASRSGQVTIAKWSDSAGNYVSINHGDGYASVYMHMTHYIVSAGDYVSAGQVIGYVGNTGVSKGNHLHFGISYNGTYVNPMEYIG